jgi:hypothetical protein
MPSTDITFCASTECPNVGICRRAHPPSDVSWLSFGTFYVYGHVCKAYWPMISHPLRTDQSGSGFSEPLGVASYKEA